MCNEQFPCGQGALCIVTSDGPICKCPTGQIGNPFPGGSCTIDQCSNQRPCKNPLVCINGRCKNKCDSGIVCGVGATCDSSTGRCVCEPNFVGTPDSICMPPILQPACNTKCGENAHCEYGLIENVCVCNSGTYGNPYELCQSEKNFKCTESSCGRNAVCTRGINSIECTCKPGFHGNPYTTCHDIDECSSQVCAENAVCINTIGSFDCKCKDNYNGNPFIICSPIDKSICTNPTTCKCDNTNVLCPSGYSCEKGQCKDLCAKKKCGPHAACNPNNKGECVCIQGYSGNPNDLTKGCQTAIGQCQTDLECGDSEICFKNGRGFRKCVDGCTKLQCGPNSVCITSHHQSNCFCIDPYKGNPLDLNRGCQLEDRAVNPHPSGCEAVACGKNEKCKMDKDVPVCHCEELYVWNPVTSACEKPSLPDCTSDDQCHETDSCRPDDLGVLKCQPICIKYNCPPNSLCVAKAHVGECVCIPGYSGHVNDRFGCRSEQHNQCTSNVQCAESEMCIKHQGVSKCISACSSLRCGPNAVCVTNNHIAQCQCVKDGSYLGDPLDLKKGCEKVPCVYNEDCPPHQLCNRMDHKCDDICNPSLCGENAICTVRNRMHVCHCPNGFHPNPHPEIECVPDTACSSSSCHPSAICEMSNAGAICKCPSKHIGDPYTKGCILQVEGECPKGNKDCPNGFICKKNKCINVCENACGPNSLCKISNGNPECSCPAKLLSLAGNAKNGCIRQVRKCSSDVECDDNGICDNQQCKSLCKQSKDCYDGETCVGNFCVLKCSNSAQCPSEIQTCNANGICQLGCRSNKNCLDDEICLNGECQKLCSENSASCGPNALCTAKNHKILCRCPDDFEPNPTPDQGCVRVPSSCSASQKCPKGYSCIENRCTFICSNENKNRNNVNNDCAIGERCLNDATSGKSFCSKVCYTNNNCLPGEICSENGICLPGCLSDADCPYQQICYQTKCKCDKGFINTAQGCGDVDECLENPCHPSAICENTPGSYRCLCPESMVGDPYGSSGCTKSNKCKKNEECLENFSCYDGQCVDLCSSSIKTCAKSAVCQVEDHVASKFTLLQINKL